MGADITHEIKSYIVTYFSGGPNGFKYRAWIELQNADGHMVGKAYFFRDAAQIPNDGEGKDGLVSCYYPAEDFPRVLDLLRNEKPIYVYYNGSGNSVIKTSSEPVGEGELRCYVETEGS